jgi:hypothetical protein
MRKTYVQGKVVAAKAGKTGEGGVTTPNLAVYLLASYPMGTGASYPEDKAN